MQELRPGLWTWTAAHPDWTDEQGGPEGWDRAVRSYAYDSGGCLVLFDPQSPPSLIEGLIEAQDVAVLLTVHWHQRSALECVERFGASVHTPAASLERTEVPNAKPYSLGDELPGGVVAKDAYYPEETIFWVPAHRALVAGDVLLGVGETGLRIQPDSWLPNGVTPEGLRDALGPLLDLPVELVLPTHGDPVAGDAHGALRAALDG
jgi:glyoxylase-like metal-dependent hydrolase (beta-lactamase superfamily II)